MPVIFLLFGGNIVIEIKNLSKTYQSAAGEITALRDISLTINDGEIFGIIGLSGAGKSTLVRCINYLEKPTSGQVIVDGQDLGKLSNKELLKTRQNIGMIFQGFNLLAQRNVIKNICYPLEIAGVKKDAALKRAADLLEDFPIRQKLIPHSFRAVRSRELLLQEHWQQRQNISSAMKPQVLSTPTPHVPFWSL